MEKQIDRRAFVKGSLLASAAAALGTDAGSVQAKDAKNASSGNKPKPKNGLPKGKIGGIEMSRVMLGGNLLSQYNHNRDLEYILNLVKQYNTEEKILETLALAEDNGIDTLSVHADRGAWNVIKKHRKRGGKIKWIVCPTPGLDDSMEAYTRQTKELIDDGCEAIYLWGVRGDPLAASGRMDLIAKAVNIAKDLGVPSGVGAHDLNVIKKCEEHKIGADFYIKTLHHHDYPSAPRPDEIKGPYTENPGYWCRGPEAVIEYMKTVEKPWIAFKTMAAGAISPTSAFKYAIEGGADFLLAGMFDFEIKQDVQIVKGLLARNLPRQRPWRA